MASLDLTTSIQSMSIMESVSSYEAPSITINYNRIQSLVARGGAKDRIDFSVFEILPSVDAAIQGGQIHQLCKYAIESVANLSAASRKCASIERL
jgi:hypothetical protein